jgi:hypothetical protein
VDNDQERRPVPDPRVQALERAIEELSREFGSYTAQAKIDMTELKHSVAQVNGHIADLMMEVGEAPDHRYREAGRPTIRSRLHVLENDKATLAVATQALKEARNNNWTRAQKTGLFAFAFIGALGVLTRLFGLG